MMEYRKSTLGFRRGGQDLQTACMPAEEVNLTVCQESVPQTTQKTSVEQSLEHENFLHIQELLLALYTTLALASNVCISHVYIPIWMGAAVIMACCSTPPEKPAHVCFEALLEQTS
jgi:hypothetical protein